MPRRCAPTRSRARAAAPGFTLLETALALVIVLVGVLSIMEAQTSFLRSNAWSSQEATATYLANELRERMRNLPRHDPIVGLLQGSPPVPKPGPEVGLGELTVEDFDDIDDYDMIWFGNDGSETLPGPIDAFGQVIPETDSEGFVVMNGNAPLPLQGWAQYVTVEKVHPYDFSENFGGPPNSWSTSDAFRAADEFPLRVTVTVYYKGVNDPSFQQVTQMSWIAPGR